MFFRIFFALLFFVGALVCIGFNTYYLFHFATQELNFWRFNSLGWTLFFLNDQILPDRMLKEL